MAPAIGARVRIRARPRVGGDRYAGREGEIVKGHFAGFYVCLDMSLRERSRKTELVETEYLEVLPQSGAQSSRGEPAAPSRPGCQEPHIMSQPTHFVHVYATIRVKVAVVAATHEDPMVAADKALFERGLGVRLIPTAAGALEADYAEEVTGYLVDEADDPEFARSANYAADYAPDWGMRPRGEGPS